MPTRPRIADCQQYRLAGADLKQQIREAVASEITGSDEVHSGPQITETATLDYVGAVHYPNEDFAAIVLKKDVGFAVAVEIASGDGMPARFGVADIEGPATCPRSAPDGNLPVAVLKENVGGAVAVEASVTTACQLGPGLPGERYTRRIQNTRAGHLRPASTR